MNRRAITTAALSLAIGIAVGWSLNARSHIRTVEYRDPLAVKFEAGHELRITQSEKPGNEFRLVPFSVKRGEHRETFGDGPADPMQLWLVTYGDAVVACRAVSSP